MRERNDRLLFTVFLLSVLCDVLHADMFSSL